MAEYKAKLVFSQGGTIVKKLKFPAYQQLTIKVGNGKGSQKVDVELNADIISRNHAEFRSDTNNNLVIVDLGSTNGTYLNQQRLNPNQEYPIGIGDIISFSKAAGIQALLIDPSTASPKSDLCGPSGVHGGGLITLLDNRRSITIGRSNTCDYVIDKATISRKHALIEKVSDGQYKIKDLGSLNGTYVNGQKITSSTKITKSDLIFLGTVSLKIMEGYSDLREGIAIKTVNLKKVYQNGYVGLHPTSITIPSKELLAIMGPSGCGKSTLMKALNGDSPATNGKVYIHDLELNENYNYLKRYIGYVPQDDIVHKELTVRQSLYYAAKLRLDSATQEIIDAKIERILNDLNIKHIQDNKIAKISGGQRKRVSIGVELLTDPLILFLDEPTSPLDPQTIEEFLGILKKLARNGTTVIMVTHKPEDLHYMDSVIFMAEGGHLTYYDKVDGYNDYFGVSRPNQVYQKLIDSEKSLWIEKFNRTHQSEKAYTTNRKLEKKRSRPFFQQYWWLTLRYFNIKTSDRANTAILLGQAPIIAILITIIFKEINGSLPFMVAISAIWFGANNAAREIVGELPIYRRERMFNLKILPYMLSKLTVLTFLSSIQVFLFIFILWVRYKNSDVTWNEPIDVSFWMLSICFSSILFGLALSAIVDSTEKVMSLIPIAIIPQILFAGIMVKIHWRPVEYLSYFTISRWGTEGFAILQRNVIEMQPILNGHGELKEEEVIVSATEVLKKNYLDAYVDGNIFGDLTGTLRLDAYMIFTISALFFIVVWWALKRKDPI